MTVRTETPGDWEAVFMVNFYAFRGEAEARLVEALRGLPGAVSLVAEQGGQMVGHILFTPVTIETATGPVPGMALAPMAVQPERQRAGVGAALIRQGLRTCQEQGHRIVVVLGHPEYYPRFGFSAALAEPLVCPWGAGKVWMALELAPGALDGVAGPVVYPEAFHRL